MTGRQIPNMLPDEIRNEIRNAINITQSNGIQSNNTSIQQPVLTGMPPSITGNQPSLYANIPQQPTGMIGNSVNGNISNMQAPMMTGVTPMISSYGPQITMPTGMLGNNVDFTNRMMPQSGSYAPPSEFQALSGNVKIPWAVTVEEKKQYKKIFKAWDAENKGFLTGETAKEIFSQSGLPQNILMQIWHLADPDNQGKLNIDGFSVAMHLIYRKLNGYNVPEKLPPELVPPSTRDLNESVDKLKKTILDDIAKKKYLNNFSASTSTVSSTSSPKHTPRSSNSTREIKKTEGNDDTEIGYVSSARRMGPDRTRRRDLNGNSASATNQPQSSYGYRSKTTRIFELRRDIEAKKKLINDLEEESKNRVATPYKDLSAIDKKDIDTTKDKIKELQQEISKTGSEQGYDAWNLYIEKTTELSNLVDQEKALEDEVKHMLGDTLTRLLSQVNETEDDLKEKKIEAIKKKSEESAVSDVPLNITGTGPNGEVTESDRIKAKAKALVAARMGKLTGKSANSRNIKADIDKVNEEREEIRLYTESISDSLNELEENLMALHMEMSMIGLDVGKQEQDKKRIEERSRFGYGNNVAVDLKEFIQQLNYEAALAKAPDIDPTFESRFPSF
ncbi:hypothetical protein BDB01DRAFT_714837 [Pilobolus umbonatus]|nr:hypothetical protein BDB01DRAFT_714837 [Pilobolus umbonatus]